MSRTIHVTVNGEAREAAVEPRLLLVDFLRETVGCDTSQCGACTVHLDGASVKACTLFAVQADGHEVKTIEGLAQNGTLHPLQEAFRETHGLQCGFCTPGMIMAAADLLAHRDDPSEAEIRHALEGNYCRCTGYHNIVRAVQHAAGHLRGGSEIEQMDVGDDLVEPVRHLAESEQYPGDTA